MIRLFVIRHGQTVANIKRCFNGINSLDITKQGKEQALDVQKKIGGLKIDEIFCSPLKRAIHTANILNANKLKIHTDQRLIERDFGKYTLKPLELVFEYQKVLYNSNHNPIETIEPYSNVLARVGDFVNYVKATQAGKNILVVTHGDIQFAFNELFGKIYDHYPDN